MNDLIKYAGIILIVLGAILLSVYVIQHMVSNAVLVSGGFLIVGGTAVYVILNRIFD
ncbi:hypothetical protein [Alkalitalea saponilacus]|uniref:Uncharacterized protein n=1 Tax=Alkalitalea saponilacus TaxID=889453 RepID=A0A1T5BLA2_9BACT|nr:hypothetical protein [Alkalitalea saponilacus]SKB47935.1 hypothetical protein SAMN03080601_00553 [Alkalitalea saponilacus]